MGDGVGGTGKKVGKGDGCAVLKGDGDIDGKRVGLTVGDTLGGVDAAAAAHTMIGIVMLLQVAVRLLIRHCAILLVNSKIK